MSDTLRVLMWFHGVGGGHLLTASWMELRDKGSFSTSPPAHYTRSTNAI